MPHKLREGQILKNADSLFILHSGQIQIHMEEEEQQSEVIVSEAGAVL
jgi:hypothetical protein